MKWEPYEVDRDVAQACRSYLTEFNLHYCAFDFIETANGLCFLEGNQAGEWSFLERSLHLGIADLVARLRVRLALR